MERNSQSYFLHADGLGSITHITDQNKTLVQSYSYDSFGHQTPTTGFRNSITYTAREWDKETGLYYYRARYYDPLEGRFISKDPIGFAGGDVNLFGYVQNNPVNRIDPLGLYDWMDFTGDTLNFTAGLGNAVTFGGSTRIAQQFMDSNDAAVLNKAKHCSGSFRGGEWASLVLGGGRLLYAGAAKVGAAAAADGAAAMAFRNGLKRVMRGPLAASNYRIKNYEELFAKYGSDEAIQAAAGRTNLGFNALGADMAAGGAVTLATDSNCGCQ